MLQWTFIAAAVFVNARMDLQVASETPALEPQPMQAERRRWCLFRCRRSGAADEDIFGKKWVTLTDTAGNRCVFGPLQN